MFLKKLEYYRGILFLTSNRINSFDAAFESRIHLTIHYPALDAASRLVIWKMFIEMGGGECGLSEAELEKLAREEEMNGREIKNVVKTARLLAKQEGVGVRMGHVEVVLGVRRGEFR